MDIWYCLECGSVFRGDLLGNSKRYHVCPLVDCVGTIFEVDELMLEPIKILNNKGYITQYCCSGHVYQSTVRGYVSFHRDINIDSAPKGWYLDENCIRYNEDYDEDRLASDVQRRKYIDTKIENLLEWVMNLDNHEWE